MQNENEAGDSEAAEVTKQMEECVQNLKVMVSQTKKSILTESWSGSQCHYNFKENL